MSNIQLKIYQEKTLDALKKYLAEARFKGAAIAYDNMTKPGVVNVRPYKPLEGLNDVPFVCLRLPTGGGKTLLSAHTVRIASEVYLEREFPLVLWLVPSNTIRQQTLEALKTPGNPNYEALRTAFDGKFMVEDISNFTQIKPQDLASKAVIIVGTVQTLKVTNTDGRKVYDHHEGLEPHFTKISASQPGMEQREDGSGIRYSFRNLLHIHRPLVIVDEAHNNSTKLSFDVLERINAACVIEFTATPAGNSNVLHSVSAMELKAEEMVKLPIVLTEHPNWEASVRDSILTRKRLEELCKGESEYIRPIVLFQAESQGDDNVTWQVLKKHLMETEEIAEEKIAVVTADQRELDGINLFDHQCPVDYVITVQALKEGWDCSFAYVFCSVANIHSAKDVEQILGRVLRMPYAKRRKHEELNKAYAHVSSTSWPNAVKLLHDKLVENMGFEQDEANDSIETRQPGLGLSEPGESFRKPEELTLVLTGNVEIAEEDKKSVVIETTKTGVVAKVVGLISDATQSALIGSYDGDDAANAKAKLQVHQATFQRYLAPANRGEKFIIPQLCLELDGEWGVPDPAAFRYAGNWNLTGPVELSEAEFSLQEDGKTFAIDIEDGQVRHSFVATAQQLNLELVDTGWTVNALSQWLDRRLRQPDIGQPQMLEFIRRTIVWLEEERKIPLTALARGKFLLQKVLESKIRKLRNQAQERGFQALLFDAGAKPKVSFDFAFEFKPDSYYPQRRYHGSFKPTKHFYAQVGEMNGEEAECAKAIEMLGDKVKYWVRNLERDEHAFRLPTSSDYFYPDFVVMLSDGRILVIEYKGEQYRGTDDVKEKQNIGELWAKESKGKGLFLMAWEEHMELNIYKQISTCL